MRYPVPSHAKLIYNSPPQLPMQMYILLEDFANRETTKKKKTIGDDSTNQS